MLIDIVSVDTTYGTATFRDADGKLRWIALGQITDPEAVAEAPLKVTPVTEHPVHLATYRVLQYDNEMRVCGVAAGAIYPLDNMWERGVPLDTPVEDVPVLCPAPSRSRL